MSFTKILIVFTLLLSLSANAEEMGFTVGFQNTDVESDGTEYDAGVSLYAGWIGYFDLPNFGSLRSGALLSQRKVSFESGSGNEDVEWISIDIPVNYLLKMGQSAALYAGLKLGLNISDDCTADPCNLESETFHYGLNLGGSFTMTPNWAAEVDVVIGLSDIAEDVEWKSSVGAGIVYLF